MHFSQNHQKAISALIIVVVFQIFFRYIRVLGQSVNASTTSISSILYLFPFNFFANLEIAYNVIAVDSMKKPISINDMEAKAIFVTI